MNATQENYVADHADDRGVAVRTPSGVAHVGWRQLLDAARQPDQELAACYRDILSQVAHHLTVTVDVDMDGSGPATDYWYSATVTWPGDPAADRQPHHVSDYATSQERRKRAQLTPADRTTVYERLAALGLARAKVGDASLTVADCIARLSR